MTGDPAIRETGSRVVLAGGGTGGHLYPGLAVAEALRAARPQTALAFLTTGKGIDARVMDGAPYPVTRLATRPFFVKRPWTWPGLAVSLVRAGLQARRRFREFCPEVAIGLGGYGSYAPLRVARKYGVATVVLNPDIAVGRANRRLAAGADLVCCQFQKTVDALAGVAEARLTGCPVRVSLLGADRTEALGHFGLDAARRTLLVTGASLGARSVNQAVLRWLRNGNLPENWQILHLSGVLDHDRVAKAYGDLDVPVVLRAYEDRMDLVYAAADLAVARAGASTVAELTATGTPAVFLPYPYHRDRHQARQARAVEAAGAAVVVEDRPDAPEATARGLREAVEGLASDAARLEAMAASARATGRPDAAEAVAAAVLDLADARTRARHEALSADVDKARRGP